MATTGRIIVEIRIEDIGRRIKCKIRDISLRDEKKYFNFIKKYETEELSKKLVKFEKENGLMPSANTLRKRTKQITLRNYASVLHYWDGYKDGLGVELKRKYNNYESALNLVLAGDISTILGGSVPYLSVDKYGGSWEDAKPMMCWDFNINDYCEDYIYLYTLEGEWKVYDKEKNDWAEY